MDFLSCFRTADTMLLVDPVMGDNGRVYKNFSPQLLDGMKQISRMADLITPNLTEACLLAGVEPDAIPDDTNENALLPFTEELAQTLRTSAHRPQDVVITGVKCREKDASFIYNIAATADGICRSRSRFFDRSYSGTGDLFASVLCGCRLGGMTTKDAVDLAVRFLSLGIADAIEEDVPSNDGIHFEKHLITLIQGGFYHE